MYIIHTHTHAHTKITKYNVFGCRRVTTALGKKVSGFRKAISLRSFIINSVVFGYKLTMLAVYYLHTRRIARATQMRTYVYMIII
jgi:hypothetical protein